MWYPHEPHCPSTELERHGLRLPLWRDGYDCETHYGLHQHVHRSSHSFPDNYH